MNITWKVALLLMLLGAAAFLIADRTERPLLGVTGAAAFFTGLFHILPPAPS